MRRYRDQNAGCEALCPNAGLSTFSAVREVYARRARFLSALAYRCLTDGDRRCAYCLGGKTAVVGRKFGLMEVRRCADCGLMFRWPKDSDHVNHSFYQDRYVEPPATDMPQERELAAMMAGNFSGTIHDRGAKLAILKAMKSPPARVLDFGCSWGYAPYQLKQAGYSVTGFEISRPRAAFGRRGLGVEIIDTYRELDGLTPHSFDAIYSHHVLEHLPALAGVFERFERLLAPGGVLVIFTPNCGDGKGNLREGWKPIVGEKHPMAFDTVFFRNALPRHGFTVKAALTTPFAAADLLSGPSMHAEDGAELLVCAILGTPDRDAAQAGH